MAYIPYGQNTTGGKQLAEVLADVQDIAAKLQAIGDWIGEIGPSNLESNTDFSVASGQGQAFNDTALQIVNAFAVWYGDGSGGTNREKISRLARGA